MKKFLFCFYILSNFSHAQTIAECRQRFNTYLDFKGHLGQRVSFGKEAIYVHDEKGKTATAIYASELPVLAAYLEHSQVKEQVAFFKWKGAKQLSKTQLDSILISVDERNTLPSTPKALPLQGYKVAIDPGHFSTNLTDAKIEQKYLFFVQDSTKVPADTIKLFESLLTFNTAKQLQTMLEAQGATVFLTRTQSNYTSFNCSFGDWLKYHKRRMLDSLKQNDLLSADKYNKLVKASDYKLFWDFFRDFDLANRANKINNFQPDVTVIIHYNVDETNAPWQKHTERNFTMAFIAGAFTADNLERDESRANFLRLLITKQLNRSEKLAGETVQNFHNNLHIPIASSKDAIYLRDNCLATPSPGVYSRNLALCRKINSPLVYGESLYQDNKLECCELMKSDLDVYGIKSNLRLNDVAKSYYEAVLHFLEQYK